MPHTATRHTSYHTDPLWFGLFWRAWIDARSIGVFGLFDILILKSSVLVQELVNSPGGSFHLTSAYVIH
jgi:hypothetical protein